MDPLRSLRPRLRAALVATLATLAASAITAPGVAHAAESDLIKVQMSASCESFVVVMFTKLPCGGRVRNSSPTDGAPTGQLRMFNEGFAAGSFPTSSRCNLQPVPGDPRASTCRITYEVRRLNPQGVSIAYLGDEAFEPAIVEDIPLRGSPGLSTATGLVCQVVSLGETGKCLATVGGVGDATTVAPTGIVNFMSIPIGAPVEFSSFSCQLQPLTLAASRCEIDYRPAKAGGWVFRASYEGNFLSHAPSTGETTVAVQPPVNAPALEVGK